MFVSLFFVIGTMNEFAVVMLIDRTNRKTNHGRPNFRKLYSPKKRSVSFNKISADVNDTNSVNTLDTPLMTNATKNLPCLQTKLILHHHFLLILSHIVQLCLRGKIWLKTYFQNYLMYLNSYPMLRHFESLCEHFISFLDFLVYNN